MKKTFYLMSLLLALVLSGMTFVSCGDDDEEPKTEEQATSKLTGKWKVRSSSLSGMGINYGDEITFNSNGTVEVGNKMGTYSYNPSTGEFTLKLGDAVITGTITFNGDSATITFTNNSGEQQTLDLRYDDGTSEVEPTDKTPNGVVAVDLGLSSGTLWANRNIGALSNEAYGDYFAWGETEGYNSGKTSFTWWTYKWCNESNKKLTKYCTDSSYGYNGFMDKKTELDPEDDAAYVNWGSKWRMPTYAQLNELKENCTWVRKTVNDIKGYKVIGPNGNSIFLPAAGRYDSSIGNAGSYGYYWSRTLNASNPDKARNLHFYVGNDNVSDGGIYMDYIGRTYYGLCVRPVRSTE